MKRTFAGLLAAAGLFAVAPATSPALAAAEHGPVAQIACKKATIGGQSRCIARGQFCARRYERDYRRYGFSCSKKDRNGRWHLR